MRSPPVSLPKAMRVAVGTDLGDGSGEEGLSMITVTVAWGGENSYGVSGVVSRW